MLSVFGLTDVIEIDIVINRLMQAKFPNGPRRLLP